MNSSEESVVGFSANTGEVQTAAAKWEKIPPLRGHLRNFLTKGNSTPHGGGEQERAAFPRLPRAETPRRWNVCCTRGVSPLLSPRPFSSSSIRKL